MLNIWGAILFLKGKISLFCLARGQMVHELWVLDTLLNTCQIPIDLPEKTCVQVKFICATSFTNHLQCGVFLYNALVTEKSTAYSPFCSKQLTDIKLYENWGINNTSRSNK